MNNRRPKICVVIPAYKVSQHIIEVVSTLGPEVDHIVVIDDCCPERSGKTLEQSNRDSRVEVIYNSSNMGVGGQLSQDIKERLN